MFTAIDSIVALRQSTKNQPDLAEPVSNVCLAIHAYEASMVPGVQSEVVATAKVNVQKAILILMKVLQDKDRVLDPTPGALDGANARVQKRAIYSLTKHLVVLQRSILR